MGKMSSVAELARKRTVRRGVCCVGHFRKSLTDDDREEFDDLLLDVDISAPAICRAVMDVYEAYLSRSQVVRHRAGECSCPN